MDGDLNPSPSRDVTTLVSGRDQRGSNCLRSSHVPWHLNMMQVLQPQKVRISYSTVVHVQKMTSTDQERRLDISSSSAIKWVSHTWSVQDHTSLHVTSESRGYSFTTIYSGAFICARLYGYTITIWMRTWKIHHWWLRKSLEATMEANIIFKAVVNRRTLGKHRIRCYQVVDKDAK